MHEALGGGGRGAAAEAGGEIAPITLSSHRLPPPPLPFAAVGSSEEEGHTVGPAASSKAGKDIDEALEQLEWTHPPSLCVGKRQRDQAEFHEKNMKELLGFWSERSLECTNIPKDVMKFLELKPRAVKRIMRRACVEELKMTETSSSKQKVAKEGEVAPLEIREDACYIMTRACELFAMDLAKRGELYMQNQSSNRRTLGLDDLLGAVERTDYCDFLLDVARKESDVPNVSNNPVDDNEV